MWEKEQHIYPLNKHSFGSQLCLNCTVHNNVGILQKTHIKKEQGVCSHAFTNAASQRSWQIGFDQILFGGSSGLQWQERYASLANG